MSSEETVQKIQCEGSDEKSTYVVFGSDVDVIPSNINVLESNIASNKVKINQISKFDWEVKYYYGNIVSSNNTYVAYVLPAKAQDDHVRVLNHNTSMRVLLKGFQKRVVDVCFESLQSNFLACIDSEGSLFIFELYEEADKVLFTSIIQIKHNSSRDEVKRVVWAPQMIPPAEDIETLFAYSCGNNAFVYNLDKLRQTYGNGSILLFDEITEGVLAFENAHVKAITCLAVSPNTNVLVTASFDGHAKFWNVNLDEPNPSDQLLHDWIPHEGEPVHCLLFCDNMMSASNNALPYWRYLVTGTAYNSVLKVWYAGDWNCIQTIRFLPYTDDIGNSPFAHPCLKVMMDVTAEYLIITDVYRQVLYVCQLLEKNSETNCMNVVSMSEFVLKEPQLSFSIHKAKISWSNNDSNDEGRSSTPESEEEQSEQKVQNYVVQLFSIGRKALQKMTIKFGLDSPPQSTLFPVDVSSQDDVASIRDGLSDVESCLGSCDEKPVIVKLPMPEECSELTDVTRPDDDDAEEKSDNLPEISFYDEKTISSSIVTTIQEESLVLMNGCDNDEGILIVLDEKDETDAGQDDTIESQPSLDATGQILSLLQSQQKLIVSQQQQINDMQETMNELKQIVQQNASTKHNGIGFEEVKESLNVCQHHLQKSMNRATKDFQKSCSEYFNSTTQSHQEQATHNIINTVIAKMDKSIKHEMCKVVVPSLEKAQASYMESFKQQLTQKVMMLENTLREECQELIKSKGLANAIGGAAASILESTMPSSYKESFQNILLPGFEKAITAIYMQINQTFQQGTKQYLERLESHLESKRHKQHEKQEPMVAALHELGNSVQAASDHLNSASSSIEGVIQKQLRSSMESMHQSCLQLFEKKILPNISGTVSQCTNDAFTRWKEQLDASFSNGEMIATASVENRETIKANVDSFINQEDYTNAFNTALGAADLSLVIYTCNNVKSRYVFKNNKNQLPQETILSLIQQLSVDLNEDTAIKIDFLMDSMLALDNSSEIINEHKPKVLESLNEQLEATIAGLEQDGERSEEIRPLDMLLRVSRREMGS